LLSAASAYTLAQPAATPPGCRRVSAAPTYFKSYDSNGDGRDQPGEFKDKGGQEKLFQNSTSNQTWRGNDELARLVPSPNLIECMRFHSLTLNKEINMKHLDTTHAAYEWSGVWSRNRLQRAGQGPGAPTPGCVLAVLAVLTACLILNGCDKQSLAEPTSEQATLEPRKARYAK